MKQPLIIVVSILGILFLICAVIYVIEPARSLPMFFPGYSATLARHHYTHAVASFVLALASFAYVWFGTGKKKTN